MDFSHETMDIPGPIGNCPAAIQAPCWGSPAVAKQDLVDWLANGRDITRKTEPQQTTGCLVYTVHNIYIYMYI